jgi:hypothetical protein
MSSLLCHRAVACLLVCAAGVSAFAVRAAEPAEQVIDLRIVGGSLPAAQRVIRVSKGDSVRWRVTSDAAGELHVHAYHLETKVAPGKPSELAFKAFATGRYRIEWHPANGQPAVPRAHHAAPLATLEVHPK